MAWHSVISSQTQAAQNDITSHYSQSHNPIVGCNPTIGCASNSYRQKHPIVRCSYIPMPTVAIRGHLKVAPYCESIVHENTFVLYRALT